MKFSTHLLTTLCLLATLSAPALAQQATTETIAPLNDSYLYTIHDLGVVGANFNQPGQPLVIANNGLISGASLVGTAEHAVLWYGKNMFDVGNPGLGGNSFGYGVNERGETAGDAEVVPSNLSTTEDFCGWQAGGFSSVPTPCVPFVWKKGHMIPLETLGGVNGAATQINNRGTIAGYAETTVTDLTCTAPQQYQFSPVVWSKGGVHALPTGSDLEGVALAINDRGEAAGGSGGCAPYNPVWGWFLQPVHALLWKKGAAIDLGNLGGALNNFAHAINNRGHVVGGSDLAGDLTSHAFLWTPESKIQDLGTVNDAVDSDTYSIGLGINDVGQIVGISASADFSILRGFVRRNGVLVDLNSLVAGSTSLYMVTACSINSKGEIIGIALDSLGQTHGYLAAPAASTSSTDNPAAERQVMPNWVRDGFRFARR